MKRTYICPTAKTINLSNASIMAGSGNVEATAGGTTDEVGAKDSNIWHWMDNE